MAVVICRRRLWVRPFAKWAFEGEAFDLGLVREVRVRCWLLLQFFSCACDTVRLCRPATTSLSKSHPSHLPTSDAAPLRSSGTPPPSPSANPNPTSPLRRLHRTAPPPCRFARRAALHLPSARRRVRRRRRSKPAAATGNSRNSSLDRSYSRAARVRRSDPVGTCWFFFSARAERLIRSGGAVRSDQRLGSAV